MSPILEIDKVTAGYGSVTVLRNLSFTVQAGENIGLFGPNGHGKTTLMRAISALLPLTDGVIRFQGNTLSSQSPSHIVASGLVHAQQGNTLFGNMAVGETLELAAFTPAARARAAQSRDTVYSLFPRLAERRQQLAKTLSGGERQMLSIAASLMCAPKLLMLDEPTLGLSPRLKEELSEALLTISRDVPLIVVEQDVQLLLAVTDRLHMIEHGELVKTIDKSNAPDHKSIMALYFGEST